MPATHGQLTTPDRVRLSYETVGDGRQTVFVPNGFYLRDDFQSLARRRRLVFYDPRNRGRSETVAEPAKLQRGILNDVDDLEALRRHVGARKIALIGHSYMGLGVVLYARSHPAHVERIVQIGAMPPDHTKQYPPELMAVDDTARSVFAKLGELQKERGAYDRRDFCRRFWSVLAALYVADPADAGRITWGHCDLPNERDFLAYWTAHLFPSIRALALTRGTLARVTVPVLTIHGRQDRSAPYGGALDWTALLPSARLLTVEDAGHAPWIEQPAKVFRAIDAFLAGRWPVR
jgi:proline iminopeptidase